MLGLVVICELLLLVQSYIIEKLFLWHALLRALPTQTHKQKEKCLPWLHFWFLDAPKEMQQNTPIKEKRKKSVT